MGHQLRVFREHPFGYQDKVIFRHFAKVFSGRELSNFICLYTILTHLASDQNGQELRSYTSVIRKKTGLSRDFIPKGIKTLEEMGLVQTNEIRQSGKFSAKEIRLMSYSPTDKPSTENTVPVKTVNGYSDTIEDKELETKTIKEHNSKEFGPVEFVEFFSNLKSDIHGTLKKVPPLSATDQRNLYKLGQRYTKAEIKETVRFILSKEQKPDNNGTMWPKHSPVHVLAERNFDRYFNEKHDDDQAIGHESRSKVSKWGFTASN